MKKIQKGAPQTIVLKKLLMNTLHVNAIMQETRNTCFVSK